MDVVILIVCTVFVGVSLAYTEWMEARREKRWNKVVESWIDAMDDADDHE